MQFQTLITIVAVLVCVLEPARADVIGALVDGVRDEMLRYESEERLGFLDWVLQDLLPLFYGQRPNNENGTMHQYREYALSDTTNDDAALLSAVSNALQSYLIET